MPSRRTLLTAGAAGAGLAAAGFGFAPTARRLANPPAGGAPPALAPEARIDPLTGAVTPNPGQVMVHLACPGCELHCGARLRLDRATGAVLRITGNPYHPLSAAAPLPAETGLLDAFAALSRAHDSGLAVRATICARGAALPALRDDAARLRTPLKRAGPRGSGQWQAIPFAQLVHEVVQGGDLFGEGPVDGLNALRHTARPHPVALLYERDNGRTRLARAFAHAHGGATLGALRPVPPAPDLRDATFVLVLGSTFSSQSVARSIAGRRAAGRLVSVVADAVLGPADNAATGVQSGWLPIRPGTEAVLARAILGRLLARPWREDAAAICGVSEAALADLARDFAAHGFGAACIATGPLDSDAALAVAALNEQTGHGGRAAFSDLTDRPDTAPGSVKLVLAWDCDPSLDGQGPVPLVVAISAFLDDKNRQADYILPDTTPTESWAWHYDPKAGIGTSWPAVPPPGPEAPPGMERFLIACGRAMDLRGFGPATPDDPARLYIRAIAALACADPPMPDITDDELALSGLERLRPALEAADPQGWRRAACLLARGGRFDLTCDAPDPDGLTEQVLATAALPPAAPTGTWPLVLAVRDRSLPGGEPDPVALHPGDAASLGLRNGDAVTVETPSGTASGPLQLRNGIMRGVVAVSRSERGPGLRDGLQARVRRA